LAAWCVFLVATAAALLLPMLLVPEERHAPEAKPARRDGEFRLPPLKGKAHER
jgi:hypothetical protein